MEDNLHRTAKFQTVEQISAGGAAFRRTAAGYETAIIAVGQNRRWQLPKGLIDAGETAEAAALREVREEAGIETDLIELLETVEYWYFGERRGERVRFHKSVHFFLLIYRAGDVADHDAEVEEARWVEAREAIKMLAFKSEKAVVEKALQMILQTPDEFF